MDWEKVGNRIPVPGSTRDLLLKGYESAETHVQNEIRKILLDPQSSVADKFPHICSLLGYNYTKISLTKQRAVLNFLGKLWVSEKELNELRSKTRAHKAKSIHEAEGKLTINYLLACINETNLPQVREIILSPDIKTYPSWLEKFYALCKLFEINLANFTNSHEPPAVISLMKRFQQRLFTLTDQFNYPIITEEEVLQRNSIRARGQIERVNALRDQES